ncbi:CPBP family intramembrane glutamic endopeptidase [Paenibacillus xerothermodurans]|uniref:CPBP family intramembrane metalloprotease n=1 Tax=Paenibacillus xerothermodurans TaxID=1977292 RepID=A0A2W1NAB9_PAEXE|nr:CPBP family intramembrane glutamic endopeptidase [Paenibacillus xerothermodurans]PZE21327.1 CPBP family intramembrane metalloprotease [Paenibacillus xerothermodurans]
MANRRSNPPLLLLAVIGIVLYLAVIIGSVYLQTPGAAADTGADDPAITKQEAAEAAAQFVQQRFGLSDDYRTSVLHQSYTVRHAYLEDAELHDEYVKHFENLPLNYFEVEINDAAKRATYYIDVDYSNQRIIGWEAYTTPALRQRAAATAATEPLQLAEQAIIEQGFELEEFTRVREEPNVTAPERRDRPRPAVGTRYLYESRDERIGEATLHLTLSVANGAVVSFHPVFNIPAAFLSWQEQQDAKAALMTNISMGVSLAMTITALYIIIRYRKEISFRRGWLLSLVFLAIYVTNNINMLPALRAAHGAGPSQLQAIVYLCFVTALAVLMAVSVYFSLLAGTFLWRRQGWDPVAEWHDRDFGSQVMTATGRGYLLCLFILGVQQGMYFIGSQYFDVWSVSDPSQSVLNMLVPGIFPLLAWAAAISEEAIYRLFGIAFFLALVRNRFLAVLLPSIVWAMSHTQYPIYPVYTRLVEVSIIGLIFGFFFLRYGFLTVLFAHATMDSILMGVTLIDTGDGTQDVIGTFYLVFPALVGWILSWLHRVTKRRDPQPTSS